MNHKQKMLMTVGFEEDEVLSMTAQEISEAFLDNFPERAEIIILVQTATASGGVVRTRIVKKAA